MSGFLVALLVILLIATLGVLLFGVITMGRGGQEGGRRSNMLMRWRVLLQFAALVVILLIFLVAGR